MLKSAFAATAVAVALGSFAAPAATALVPCEDGDIECYKTCYLPHKGPDGYYWVNC